MERIPTEIELFVKQPKNNHQQTHQTPFKKTVILADLSDVGLQL